MGNKSIDNCNSETPIDRMVKRLTPIASGAIAGLGTIGIGKLSGIPIQGYLEKFVKKQEPYNSIFKDAAEKYLNINGIPYTNLTGIDSVKNDNFVIEYLKKHPLETSEIIDCTKGRNACVLIDKKTAKIFANFDKSSVLTFHEMGHIDNFKKPLAKFLQVCGDSKFRNLVLISTFVSALLPDVREPDVKDSPSKTLELKFLKFANKNCAAIAALSFLPEVLEEGLANIKGAKIAKGLLSKDMYAKVVKMNKKSMMTYIFTALVMPGGIWIAKKINDLLKNKLAANQVSA